MKRSTKIFMVFLSVFSLIIFNSHSPGEDVVGPNGCAECHSGGTSDGSVTVTPNSGCIGINASIFMTVCVNDSDAIEAGFNIKASAGTMNPGAGSRSGWGGPTILTHNAPKLISNGQACWTFEWISPPNTGNVTFDVWGNALNDDDWYTGDAPYFVSTNLEVKIALPVEFTAFDVLEKNNQVLVNWTTQSEKENDQFIIERSYDGENFEAIGKVEGISSSTGNSYSFTDLNPILEQTSYYRIQQQDIDGRFAYTDVESIFVKSSGINQLQIYPSIANRNEDINIIFTNSDTEKTVFFVVDQLGRKISEHTFESEEGRNEFSVGTTGLDAGLYYLLGGSDRNKVEAVSFVVR